jgi:hypothetical protein
MDPNALHITPQYWRQAPPPLYRPFSDVRSTIYLKGVTSRSIVELDVSQTAEGDGSSVAPLGAEKSDVEMVLMLPVIGCCSHDSLMPVLMWDCAGELLAVCCIHRPSFYFVRRAATIGGSSVTA